VTLNHGAGVPGAPPSTSSAKSMAELLTEVTVTACIGSFGPLATPLNVRLEFDNCRPGFCATPSGAKVKIPPARTKHRRKSRYVIGN
jgi:hypothetical protein